MVYTTLHAGGKFDDSAYKTSGGLHGVGSSVVNALSTYMDVQISRDGYIHHDRYEQGKPVIELEDGLLPTIGKTRKTGTKVNFLPDDTIFEKTKFRGEEVKISTENSKVPVYVVPTNEELAIARETVALAK